ncbi:C-type lectin lectoxin-Lio3-like [Diabrotica virgifera virgifera]|uniref:C-type lectin domain-containing protein n=1 Tax=Diabrotica virgifera virgifera TaxID=50390 RepID=A0ABM5JU50_DIAVI|nr:C-type lectin lectoxin-Lio3-like [Diabrotica virgifera virgifera]
MMMVNILLLIVFCVLITDATSSDTCTKETSPKTVFNIIKRKYNWSQSIKACQDEGATLVSIQTKEKSDAIYNFLISEGISSTDVQHAIWTSGNKLKDKVNWFWLAQEPVVFTNWAKGEPNYKQSSEYCINFYNNGSSAVWNDENCEIVDFYPLCEKPVCSALIPLPPKEVRELHCHCHCGNNCQADPGIAV